MFAVKLSYVYFLQLFSVSRKRFLKCLLLLFLVYTAPAPSSPGHIPGQPQVVAINPDQQLSPDRVGMDAVNNVMQFVTSSFGRARLVDSHSVSGLIK